MAVDLTEARISFLSPNVADRARWLIYILRVWGLPIIVAEGWRSDFRQRELFASGRTRPGPILTNTLKSAHRTGAAFDIDVQGIGADDVPQWVWSAAGYVGEWLGLTWGGRFQIGDFRHFEL